jgi:hypothetical protein
VIELHFFFCLLGWSQPASDKRQNDKGNTMTRKTNPANDVNTDNAPAWWAGALKDFFAENEIEQFGLGDCMNLITDVQKMETALRARINELAASAGYRVIPINAPAPAPLDGEPLPMPRVAGATPADAAKRARSNGRKPPTNRADGATVGNAEKKLLDALHDGNGRTSQELQVDTGLDKITIRDAATAMIAAGVLVKTGNARGTRYALA